MLKNPNVFIQDLCFLCEDLGVRCRVGNHKSLPQGKSIVTQQFLGRIHNNTFLISDIFITLITEKTTNFKVYRIQCPINRIKLEEEVIKLWPQYELLKFTLSYRSTLLMDTNINLPDGASVKIRIFIFQR